MRGKGTGLMYRGLDDGITPAYAGKRSSKSIRRNACRDHPRLCGEKLSGNFNTMSTTGSPPPMRGKVISSRPYGIPSRITPAYAGKRRKTVHGKKWKRDHPRLCGEKVGKPLRCRLLSGSPPPMRGKADKVKAAFAEWRITPAYAGKSSLHLFAIWLRLGSPPPMRGKEVCYCMECLPQ